MPRSPQATLGLLWRGHRAAGFTLVELMIGMVLGMVLVGTLLQVYLGSKESYRLQEGLARLQENSRFAGNWLAQYVHLAGYKADGVQADEEAFSADPARYLAGVSFSRQQVIAGADDVTAISNVKPSTDVFLVRHRGSESCARLAGDNPAQQPPACVQRMRVLDKADPNPDGLIRDCVGGNVKPSTDVFLVRHRGSESCARLAGDNPAQQPPACVQRMRTLDPTDPNPDGLVRDCAGGNVDAEQTAVNGFYVGRDNVLRCAATSNATPQGLIDGVEDMQVLYGVDTDGDQAANQYLTASRVAGDWNAVVSVRIALLVSTVDEVTREPDIKTYRLLDPNASVGPFRDGRRRQVFTTTINLRNRTP